MAGKGPEKATLLGTKMNGSRMTGANLRIYQPTSVVPNRNYVFASFTMVTMI